MSINFSRYPYEPGRFSINTDHTVYGKDYWRAEETPGKPKPPKINFTLTSFCVQRVFTWILKTASPRNYIFKYTVLLM